MILLHIAINLYELFSDDQVGENIVNKFLISFGLFRKRREYFSKKSLIKGLNSNQFRNRISLLKCDFLYHIIYSSKRKKAS